MIVNASELMVLLELCTSEVFYQCILLDVLSYRQIRYKMIRNFGYRNLNQFYNIPINCSLLLYLGYCGPQSVLQQLNKQFFENGLYPPRNFPVTCSLVVLPRLTRTIWKPVNPNIGINSNDMMQITTNDTTIEGWK